MLTKKGKYGLKAMIHLAESTPGEPILASEIADEHLIPKKFLDGILGELRNAGFVQTRKGRGGGYLLALSARNIRVGDIVRALDGPLAPIPCVSKTRYQPCDDCKSERACSVRLIMARVRNAVSDVLDTCTLEEMAAGTTPRQQQTRRRRESV